MTLRQQQIVDFIDEFWKENWTSPNVRQIAAAVGLASPATVHDHLRRMVAQGILETKKVDRFKVLYRRRPSPKNSWPPTMRLIRPPNCS